MTRPSPSPLKPSTLYQAFSWEPKFHENRQFHNTLTVRTLLRVFMGSIQERRAFFGCDMNTWEPKIHEKLPISQHIDRQDLATSVHGEYPGKAGPFLGAT